MIALRNIQESSAACWSLDLQGAWFDLWENNSRFIHDLRQQLELYWNVTLAANYSRLTLESYLRAWRISALSSRPSHVLRDQHSLNESRAWSESGRRQTSSLAAKKGMPQMLPDAGLFDSILGGLSASLGKGNEKVSLHDGAAPHQPLELDYCFPERFLRT